MTNGPIWTEIDGVPDRQPAFCPYCGESPAFGGLGEYGDGYRHHCPECGQEFATFLPRVDA